MTKLPLLCLFLLLILSCSKEKTEMQHEEISSSITDAVGGFKNLRNISNAMEDITKNTERLKSLTPLGNEALKSVLPESVMGLERTSLSVGENSIMQIATAEAEYSGETEKKVTLKVMDGAGETGSAMVSLILMGFSADSEKTTTEGIEKTGKYNGVQASIKEKKRNDRLESEIEYIIKDRYLISIEGEGYTVEELKGIMATINTSALK